MQIKYLKFLELLAALKRLKKLLGLYVAFAVVLNAMVAAQDAFAAQAITYIWSGTFSSDSGPFANNDFSITFEIDDPASPTSPGFNPQYLVNATLEIDGVGSFTQNVNFTIGFPVTTAGIGGFTDILVSGDSLYFGICTGGSCNDPVLWNGNGFFPELFLGTFALGLDSSCTFASPCDNAIANYFDGAGGGFTAHYEGVLYAGSNVDVLSVIINIKPGSASNSINLKSRGIIPVAILTTDDFDATSVDPLSVEFGPNGALEVHGKGHVEDVDEDGDLDLVLHFKTQETGFSCGDTEAYLTGESFEGQIIEGADNINIVKCN